MNKSRRGIIRVRSSAHMLWNGPRWRELYVGRGCPAHLMLSITLHSEAKETGELDPFEVSSLARKYAHCDTPMKTPQKSRRHTRHTLGFPCERRGNVFSSPSSPSMRGSDSIRRIEVRGTSNERTARFVIGVAIRAWAF